MAVIATVVTTMDLVTDCTTNGGTGKRMVSGRIADNATDGGALQASASVRWCCHDA